MESNDNLCDETIEDDFDMSDISSIESDDSSDSSNSNDLIGSKYRLITSKVLPYILSIIIQEVGIRGFKSFGNNEQVLKLNTEKGELILLVGNNGAGKCVDKKTSINIEINDLQLSDELIIFLEKTDSGKRIFLYIKENNSVLYEKIEKYKRGQ
jgi:hypothetical protein